ncbi:MAG: stage III sporulation protein AG [Thermacetogeniaceae bacterium]
MTEKLEDIWSDLTKRYHFLRGPRMWQLLLVFGIGLLLLVISGPWFGQRSSPTASEPVASVKSQPVASDDLTPVEQELEGRLAGILSAVDGAGSVQVTITLKAGAEHVYAQNVIKQDQTIQEKDQNGGNRTTNEVNETDNLVLLQTANGGKDEPVVVKDKHPEIAGVLVLAEGASNPDLRERLIQAVQTVLDVPSYRVMVLPKGRR